VYRIPSLMTESIYIVHSKVLILLRPFEFSNRL
jgi:hypothetical protein